MKQKTGTAIMLKVIRMGTPRHSKALLHLSGQITMRTGWDVSTINRSMDRDYNNIMFHEASI